MRAETEKTEKPGKKISETLKALALLEPVEEKFARHKVDLRTLKMFIDFARQQEDVSKELLELLLERPRTIKAVASACFTYHYYINVVKNNFTLIVKFLISLENTIASQDDFNRFFNFILGFFTNNNGILNVLMPFVDDTLRLSEVLHGIWLLFENKILGEKTASSICGADTASRVRLLLLLSRTRLLTEENLELVSRHTNPAAMLDAMNRMAGDEPLNIFEIAARTQVETETQTPKLKKAKSSAAIDIEETEDFLISPSAEILEALTIADEFLQNVAKFDTHLTVNLMNRFFHFLKQQEESSGELQSIFIEKPRMLAAFARWCIPQKPGSFFSNNWASYTIRKKLPRIVLFLSSIDKISFERDGDYRYTQFILELFHARENILDLLMPVMEDQQNRDEKLEAMWHLKELLNLKTAKAISGSDPLSRAKLIALFSREKLLTNSSLEWVACHSDPSALLNRILLKSVDMLAKYLDQREITEKKRVCFWLRTSGALLFQFPDEVLIQIAGHVSTRHTQAEAEKIAAMPEHSC